MIPQTEALDALNGALPPGRRPAPRWVPIRTLDTRHRAQLRDHLLALGNTDRLLRFGHMASDERIHHYTAQIDFARDQVFGVFDRRLRLVAVAHLAFEGDSAEFGVSVHPSQRGRGIGARLFEHAVMHARNRGVRTLFIYTTRDNAAMLRIVRQAGAAVRFEGPESVARLPLAAGTVGSQLEAMFGHQAAELDYRLKLQVLRDTDPAHLGD